MKSAHRFSTGVAALILLGLCLSGCNSPQGPEPALGNDASLSSLSVIWIELGPLDFGFLPSTTTYSLDVPHCLHEVSLTPISSSSAATIKVNGKSVASGQSITVTFNEGENLITAEVTAEDGVTVKNYVVTVTRAASDPANAKLAWLLLSAGTLVPGFDKDTLSYSASVALSVNEMTVTPFVSDLSATVKVNGNDTLHATASDSITLSPGGNDITIVVTAGNGNSTRTYTVTVDRAASTNANLANLVPSVGSLSPAFDLATTGYTVSVANSVSSIRFTPTGADAGATITVDGTPVTSGQQSGVITLTVGANTVNVVVTAEDGTTTKTYTVTVNRAESLLHSISGKINGTGTIDLENSLWVWWWNNDTGEWGDVGYTDGSFPRDYIFNGLPDGTYGIGAKLDIGANGNDPGDLYGQYPSLITLAGADVAGIDFTVKELAEGKLTVFLYNAGASNRRHVYFGVLAEGDEPGVDPWLGFGFFTIYDGTGQSQALDESLSPLTLPGGDYDVYLFIDTKKNFNYPPEPEDVPTILPYAGVLAGKVGNRLNGHTTFYFNYADLEGDPDTGEIFISSKLVNPVSFDGQITNSQEWADTNAYEVSLDKAWGWPNKQVARNAAVMTVRFKNDDTWLYMLYRIAWSPSEVDSNDGAQISLFIGPYGPPWAASDNGWVSAGGVPEDLYGWDESQWHLDIDVGGQNDVQGAASHDGTFYWFEFRKKLKSGDGFDWSLDPPQTVGNPSAPNAEPMMMVCLYDSSAAAAYEQYISVSLSE